MKNKIYLYFVFLCLTLINTNFSYSNEIFKFNVSEIEIIQNGNVFRGYNGGEVLTNDGLSIEAEKFEYNKIANILYATKNVKIMNSNKNLIIYADKILYSKNQEIINAEGKILAIDKNKKIRIKSEKFSFLKIKINLQQK